MVFSALRLSPAGRRRNRAVRPQLVQPRRRRARHGILLRGRLRGVFPHRPGIRADAGPLRDHSPEILVLDHRSGAEHALPDAHPRPAQAVEAQPHGSRIAPAMGAYTKAKEEMTERTHIPESRWWVVEGVDKKR